MTKSKWAQALIPVAAILAIMLLSQTYTIHNEITKKPLIIEKLRERDAGYFYNTYVIGEPLKENRQFIGKESAPVTFVAYLDAESGASTYFIKELYPLLKKEYIDTGIVKFYPKHYLTKDDIDRKNRRYMKEKALDCMEGLAPDNLETAYLNTFGNITIHPAGYGIGEDSFRSCLEGNDSEELLTDMSETEQFYIGRSNARFFIGVEGTNSRKIEGIPPYTSLKRQLHELELSIGK